MEIKITIMVLLSAALHPLWNAMIKRDPQPEGAFVGNSAILVVLAGAHSLIAGHDLLAITKIWHLLAITVVAKLIYTASLVTMLRRGDLSAYYPIARSSPAFIVLVSALFLGALYTPSALAGIGIAGLSVLEVRGFGRQRGHREVYRGAEYTVDFVPKIKVEVAVKAADKQAAIDAIVQASKTGQTGDGKVLVSAIEEAVRVRTGETGDSAL